MATLELRIPTGMREFARGAAIVPLEATTVGAALRRWAEPHDALARRLFGNDGRLRESIALFLNDRALDGPDRSETPVRDGDRLEIVATMAGG